MAETELLASVYRGGYWESEHRGSIAVADETGRLIAYAGDPNTVAFLRSSAKPFQALPAVSSGAADRFGFTLQEVAILTGSHSGSAAHVAVVKSILSKIGLTEQSLLCGAHNPQDNAEAQRLRKSDENSSALHNNCSGKHAGMLALAVDMGQSTSDYLENDHPVQRAIREAICDLSGLKPEQLKIAMDGCSAPNFAIPLVSAARLFARLAVGRRTVAKSAPSSPTLRSLVGSGKTWSRTDALALISEAMKKHPEMVSAPGRFDTELMKAFPTLVAKGGAEGFQGIGFQLDQNGNEKKFGIAVKISDGNGRRALPPVIWRVLEQLHLMTSAYASAMEIYRNPKEKNVRGIEVGDVRSDFSLKRM